MAIFDDGDGDSESLHDLVLAMTGKQIPHVVLVSKNTSTDKNHTLQKPFTAEQLLSTLRLPSTSDFDHSALA